MTTQVGPSCLSGQQALKFKERKVIQVGICLCAASSGCIKAAVGMLLET